MNEHQLGLESRLNEFHVFFGNRLGTLDSFKKKFSSFKFLRLKQTHGNVIHEVSAETPDFEIEGDGMITKNSGLALCSMTADCVPVLMAATDSGWIGSFHAGWRGVANKIVPAGAQRILEKGGTAENIRIWIGPHILQDSFEVEKDTRDLILSALPNQAQKKNQWDFFCYDGKPGKHHVSLVQVLLEQIKEKGVPLANIELELEDTLTQSHLYSSRREPKNPARLISWISKEK